METAVEIRGAVVDDTLAFCVPVHTVAKLVKSAKWQKSSEVTISFDGSENAAIEFGAGGLRVDLQVRPYADYPAMPAPETVARFDLFADDFRRALENVAFTMSTEETRYYLNGVYMHANERDGLTFVATDGHRLARYVLPQPAADVAGAILPASLIKLLQRRLKARGRPDWLTVELAHNQVTIRHGSETITSKLIDGTFPDYMRVIPADNDKVLTVDGAELIAAVKQVKTISSDRGRAVKVECGRYAVKLTVTNPDSGSASIDVPAHFDSVEPFEIGVNSQYLIDVVSKVSEPVFSFADADTPMRLADMADLAHTIVLMPMRI
jgi:DNA polymerase-3 subunit beta